MNTTDTISVTVNGEARRIPGGRRIGDLLEDLSLHPRMVVVEHNREILDRARLGEVELAEGDVLEIVHFVGGG